MVDCRSDRMLISGGCRRGLIKIGVQIGKRLENIDVGELRTGIKPHKENESLLPPKRRTSTLSEHKKS